MGKSKSRQKFQVLFYFKKLNKVMSEGTASCMLLVLLRSFHFIGDTTGFHGKKQEIKTPTIHELGMIGVQLQYSKALVSAKTLVENQSVFSFF